MNSQSKFDWAAWKHHRESEFKLSSLKWRRTLGITVYTSCKTKSPIRTPTKFGYNHGTIGVNLTLFLCWIYCVLYKLDGFCLCIVFRKQMHPVVQTAYSRRITKWTSPIEERQGCAVFSSNLNLNTIKPFPRSSNLVANQAVILGLMDFNWTVCWLDLEPSVGK